MGKRIAVLISGAGSNLAALLERNDLGGEIVLVAADRSDAGGLKLAEDHDVTTIAVALKDFGNREQWEAALMEGIAHHKPDVIVLAGFMKVLSPVFVHRWPVLNVHPSLLPAFPGAHAVDNALAYGVKVSGCTVHFVDEQVDHGPIIAQEAVPVVDGDDASSLHERIKTVEHRLLGDAVRAFCHGELRVQGRQVESVSTGVVE